MEIKAELNSIKLELEKILTMNKLIRAQMVVGEVGKMMLEAREIKGRRGMLMLEDGVAQEGVLTQVTNIAC